MTEWKEHAFVDKNEIDHSIQIRNVGCSQLGGASSFGRQFLLDQSTEVQDQGYSKLQISCLVEKVNRSHQAQDLHRFTFSTRHEKYAQKYVNHCSALEEICTEVCQLL
jgi:hypothetical protein